MKSFKTWLEDREPDGGKRKRRYSTPERKKQYGIRRSIRWNDLMNNPEKINKLANQAFKMTRKAS
jgi:cytochrome oxidase Cu insertion factor (SCO1/SenC/PrrC family)